MFNLQFTFLYGFLPLFFTFIDEVQGMGWTTRASKYGGSQRGKFETQSVINEINHLESSTLKISGWG